MNDQAAPLTPALASVHVERLLPGPIERVWAFITESGKRARWFAGGEMELREGGKVELVFDHDQLSSETYPPDSCHYKGSRSIGHVLQCEPPRLLAYAWHHEGKPDSEVRFELTSVGTDVKLVITHSRAPSREALISFSSGWDVHVSILEDVLKGQVPRPFWTTIKKVRKEVEKRI